MPEAQIWCSKAAGPQTQNALAPLTDGRHPDRLAPGVSAHQNRKVSAYVCLSVPISKPNPTQTSTKGGYRTREKRWKDFRVPTFGS